MQLRSRRVREQARVLVWEGASDSLPEPEVVQAVVPPPPSRFEVEFNAAMNERRYQSAAKRWRIATEAGRIDGLEWWSLEDALPYWW